MLGRYPGCQTTTKPSFCLQILAFSFCIVLRQPTSISSSSLRISRKLYHIRFHCADLQCHCLELKIRTTPQTKKAILAQSKSPRPFSTEDRMRTSHSSVAKLSWSATFLSAKWAGWTTEAAITHTVIYLPPAETHFPRPTVRILGVHRGYYYPPSYFASACLHSRASH